MDHHLGLLVGEEDMGRHQVEEVMEEVVQMIVIVDKAMEVMEEGGMIGRVLVIMMSRGGNVIEEVEEGTTVGVGEIVIPNMP